MKGSCCTVTLAGGTALRTSAAIASLREYGTPYHLAHGLLDHAQLLSRWGDTEAAAAAAGEARDIARRPRCRPLLDRTELIPTQPAVSA